MQLFQQSEATAAQRRILVYLVDDTDGKTAEVGVTIIAGDIKISKNGAAEANHAGVWTEIAGGLYHYEFTAAELDTLGFGSFRLVKTGIRTFIKELQVVPWDPYDSVRLGVTALPNAAAEAAGGLYTRGTGAGQINQDANGRVDIRGVAMAADVITASALAADAVAEIVNAQFDELTAETRAAGSYGQLFKDNVNASIAAVKAKTDLLTFTIANKVDSSIQEAGDFSQAAADKVFGIGGATLTELSQAIPPVNPRPDQALMILFMALRNRLDIDSTTLKIYNDAGIVITKKALTDDGTTYSEAEAVSGP